MADRGVRGGIVRWHKTNYYHEPLGKEDSAYLDELVYVRKYLQAGKGNEDKHYERLAREGHLRHMLYDWYSIGTDEWECRCKTYCLIPIEKEEQWQHTKSA